MSFQDPIKVSPDALKYKGIRCYRSMDTNAFVNELYQKIIVAVKASNSIPSEEDEYHYYLKHNTSFSSSIESCKSSIHRLVVNLAKSTSHEPNEQEDSDATQLFQHSDPKEWITDTTDHFLDETFRLLEGQTQHNENINSNSQLENYSAEFTKQSATSNSVKKFEKVEMAKPQHSFHETIDNSTAPFVSKLSSKPHAITNDFPIHEDDASFHPYYNELVGLKIPDCQLYISEMDTSFDKISIQKALFLWVDSTDTFQQMLQILQQAHALAIDLEHHNYRSYLGLTCLMQISTNNHDFLVDTLALRSSLQQLNQVFCDPKKLKVLHGAEMDILWLQRDLGLYVVNMFDTGRAARLLQLPRFSLAHLLKRYCDIDADKQYQLADWRQRPLSVEMTRYAREDTRYLLFIYKRMKEDLLLKSDPNASNLVREVHKQSTQLCLQVYSKPQVSEDDCRALLTKLTASAGVAAFSELQQRVFRRLYFWRDAVAREEDESSMYVLPNQLLVQITGHLPANSDQLLRLRNVMPPLIQKYASEIVGMISAEREMLRSDDTKAVPMISSTAQTTRKVAMESPTVNHKPWRSMKRKITIVKDDKLLHKRLRFPSNDQVNDNSSKILKQVRDTVGSIVFTVERCDKDSMQFGVPEKVSNSAVKEPDVPDQDEPFPESISEMYKLPRKHYKTSRKQCMKKNAPEKERDTALIDTVDTATNATDHAQAPYKPFDYNAASSKLSTNHLTTQDQNPPQRKMASKKALIASGYNPFLAAQSAQTPKDSSRQMKHFPLKKLSQAPRNATFQ